MSKVAIAGNASGTGTFTIQAPNSNTDRVLSLPDEAGTVLTGASDIESQVKTATNATGSAPIYACRAWVNFNGAGTVAIRDSGNISSVVDTATGRYTINFSTAMPDVNYAIPVGVGRGSSGSASSTNVTTFYPDPTTSAIYLITMSGSAAIGDREWVTLSVFR